MEEGGVGFLKDGMTPNGSSGAETSSCSNSSSSDESETELCSLCATVDVSESDELPDEVEGAYSCFRGEDDLRGRFFLGVKVGVLDPFSWTGLGDL